VHGYHRRGCEVGEVGPQWCEDPRLQFLSIDGQRRLRKVTFGQAPAEFGEQTLRQAAGSQQTVELRLGGELTHTHGPFGHLAVAAQPQSATGIPHDGKHIEVQGRREGTVAAQLLPAEMLAQRQRRKVDEGEADRLLHFIGVVAGEDHPGDVGLDDLDAGAGVRERLGAQQTRKVLGKCHGASIASGKLRIGMTRCHTQHRRLHRLSV
jgi:hypothetical protein